jgi:hypothetical protein
MAWRPSSLAFRSGEEVGWIGSPILEHQGQTIEFHQEPAINSLAKQTGRIKLNNGTIVVDVPRHRCARIHDEPGPNRKILVWFQHHQAVLALPIVPETQIVRSQMKEGGTVSIECPERQFDFVDRKSKVIRIGAGG